MVEKKNDADKNEPNVPGDKVKVDNANKDKFPEGTTVTVGDDGTATVNYTDGSKDTIPGDQLVKAKRAIQLMLAISHQLFQATR